MNTAAFPLVQVAVSAFEQWPLPADGFNLAPSYRPRRPSTDWIRPCGWPGSPTPCAPRCACGGLGPPLRPSSTSPGDFGPVAFGHYEWDRSYLTREYPDLLSTYSGHRAVALFDPVSLHKAIADLIDSHYHSRVTRRYPTQLAVTLRTRRPDTTADKQRQTHAEGLRNNISPTKVMRNVDHKRAPARLTPVQPAGPGGRRTSQSATPDRTLLSLCQPRHSQVQPPSVFQFRASAGIEILCL